MSMLRAGLRPLPRNGSRPGDVKKIDGRKVQPSTTANLSEKHAVSRNGYQMKNFPQSAIRNRQMGRRPLRARPIIQSPSLWYRAGIITPEMESSPSAEKWAREYSSVGEAASFPSNGRDANSVPYTETIFVINTPANLRRERSARNHPEFLCGRRSRAARHHSHEHQITRKASR